jgi:MFS family permease
LATVPENKSASALIVAVAGAVSLAAAMGIGRFAFTPLLPMMLHDGLVDLHGGSTLATSNYLGYLLGAILCMMAPGLARRFGWVLPDSGRMVQFALVMTGMLTLAMTLDMASLWPVWRFLSGVISAVGFVFTSAWCLSRLAALGSAHMAGIIFVGPGLGIAVSGLAAYGLTAAGTSSVLAWGIFGISALVLTVVIWPILTSGNGKGSGYPVAQSPTIHVRQPWTAEHIMLTLAYGLAGLGYIVTATFLPVIARAALPGSAWVDLFWPLFGIAVAVGALMSRFVPMSVDRRTLLAICYVLQGLGVLASLVSPDVVGFVVGSILLGVPFTTITLFALQEVRRLRPLEATGFMGLLTASYAIGQIAGPPMVSAILARSASPEAGFMLSLEIAAGSLFVGALAFVIMQARFASKEVSDLP